MLASIEVTILAKLPEYNYKAPLVSLWDVEELKFLITEWRKKAQVKGEFMLIISLWTNYEIVLVDELDY